FRTVHGKIPTKRLLNYLIPDTYPSPAFIHCHHSGDTFKHLIYECPVKRNIWNTTITTFLPPKYKLILNSYCLFCSL
ncbi:uncharacterized protein BX663DRAFT_437249, partial [Cokeromyces recurvatus]|uniref:uncharacterized protein n=1 Tax=Cokeromyces recurvatus TaxID=90255 RepID=UPI0022209E78